MAELVEIPSIAKKAPVFCNTSERQRIAGAVPNRRSEVYYIQMFAQNLYWTNAGIFSEKVTGLNLKERIPNRDAEVSEGKSWPDSNKVYEPL